MSQRSRIRQEPSLRRRASCPELCRFERRLVQGFRRWLRGDAEWDRAARDATRVLRPAQAMVFLNAVNGLAEVIDANARRVIRLRTPSSKRVSTDERALIALFGAAQHGRFGHARAILDYLVAPGCHAKAMAHVVSVTRVLDKAALRLAPPRAQRPPAGCEAPLRAIA